jgi:hypothetical protein
VFGGRRSHHERVFRNRLETLKNSRQTQGAERMKDQLAAVIGKAILGKKRGELEAKLAKAVDAVWGEYQDSVTNKWTFRREHIEGAILRSIAAIKEETE